jgi:tetratricopeptide (TPR) repeat protein
LLALSFMTFFSFHLQIPGIALALAFCLAVLANPGSRDARPDQAQAVPGKRRKSTRPSKPMVALGYSWRILIPLVMIWPLMETIRRWPGEYYTYQARQVYYRENDPLKLIELLDKALAHDQNNYETFFMLGEARRQLGLNAATPQIKHFYFQNAIDAYRKSIALYPKYLPSRWFLARVYDYYGRFEQSDAIWEELLQDDPTGQYNLAYYAVHLHMKGQLAEAIELYTTPHVVKVPFIKHMREHAVQAQRQLQAKEKARETGQSAPERPAEPSPSQGEEARPDDPLSAPAPENEASPPEELEFELELHKP